MDEDTNTMDIAVGDEKLAQAIGRGGQNIRLASDLTGWNLNVMTVEEADAKSEAEGEQLQAMFREQLDVDDEVAAILVQEGFTSVDEIAYVPEEELLDIEEFDDEVAEELRNRARDVLLTRAIASAEGGDKPQPADDLLEVAGMDETTARELGENGIVTRDDLAELGTDELVELIGIEDEVAGELIMAARAHWFADEEEEEAPTNP